MAGTATPIFPQTIKNWAATSNGTTKVTLVTGDTNGDKIESIIATNTAGTAYDLILIATISAVDYQLTTISIPVNAGNTNAVVAIDILRHSNIPGLAFDSNGNKYLYVASGTTLSFKLATAAITTVQLFAQGGQF